jgi:hypothetical protein
MFVVLFFYHFIYQAQHYLKLLSYEVLSQKDSTSVHCPPRTLFTRVSSPHLKCTTIITT